MAYVFPPTTTVVASEAQLAKGVFTVEGGFFSAWYFKRSAGQHWSWFSTLDHARVGTVLVDENKIYWPFASKAIYILQD
jgi:hypothetical protein